MPRWLLILSLACLASGGAAAQATGQISGTVEDPTGAPIPGARVTLAQAGSSTIYAATVTSSSGVFVLADLVPQSYDLTVRSEGFRTEVLTDQHVDAGGTLSPPTIRFQLPVDFDAVTPPPNLQTADVAVTSSLAPQQLNWRPVARRDPFRLVETLPGLQDNGRAASIYGQSPTVANIALDGVNVQTSFVPPQSLNSIALPLRNDQVGEASVVTGAIFGCGCSQIAFTTPVGRNALHGSGYWLGLPSALAAQYWTDNSRGTPATTSLNQLGATLGGGLLKNRLFFFANYEANLDRSKLTRTGDVPTHALTSQDAVMQRALNLLPSSPSGTYRGTQQNGATVNLGLLRLNYLPSARHSFGLTLSGATSATDDPADSSVFGPKPDTTLHLTSQFYAASWRWSIAPKLTNEVRAGVRLPTLDFRNSLRDQFGFIAILNDPSISTSQPMTGMDPRRLSDNLYSYQDNVHWVIGKHTWQFGAWAEQHRLNTDGFNNGLLDSLTVPRYVIDSIATGAVAEIDQRFNITSPDSGYTSAQARSRLSTNQFSGYFHDDWKLLRSLDISLGFRYDYLSPANETTGAAIVPSFSSFTTDAIYDQNLAFGFASTHQALYKHDFDNDSPYLGAAWKPFDALPLVVRGGVSLSYIPNDLLANMSLYALRNPFQSFNVSRILAERVSVANPPATPVPQLPSALTLPTLLSLERTYRQPPGTVYSVSGDLRTPNVEYWNIGIETRAGGFLFDARYLGNRLNEAARSVNRNQVQLPPAFLAAFLKVRSALASGNTTSGFPLLPGGGLCSNFSTTNCQPDLHAISLIQTGQAGELAHWYMAQGYAPDINAGYFVLGNPLAPGGINLLSKLGTARYDALELTVSRHAASGLNLTASYVFSKVLSNLDDYQQGSIDPYLYLHNPSLEWAPAPFNQKHAFKLTATWDIPFMRSRKALGNWSLSSIVIAQSGAPFSLLSGGYVTAPNGQVSQVSGLGTFVAQSDSGQNTVATSLTAGQIGKFFGVRENPDGTVGYVHAPAGSFQEPGPAELGNLQRRMFTGPGAFNLNLGLRKMIPLTERNRVELRAESINVLNNVNWLVGDQTFLGTAFDNNVRQWKAPRTIQFSLRLFF